MRRVLRRLCILVLSLSLVAGASVQYAAAAKMGSKLGSMTSVMNNGSMPDDCGECAGKDAKMSMSACVAYCSVVIAIIPPIALPFSASMIWMPIMRVRHFAGKTIPPDPYPPRPTILR